MSKQKLLVCILFSLAVVLFGDIGIAYSFNVSPSRVEISVAPSKSYKGVLTIRNSETKTWDVKIRTEDWFKAVEGIDKKGSLTIFNWLEIAPLEFALGPNEAKEVSFKATVPKEAKGELNAMIFIEGRPKAEQKGAIGINTSIGIPIYVMVKGTERFDAEIEDLKIVTASPLQLAVVIKNSGNVHIRPRGAIEIRNVIAKPEGRRQSLNITVPLNEYNYPILPNSTRQLEIRTDKTIESGEYVAYVKMGYGDRWYRKKVRLRI